MRCYTHTSPLLTISMTISINYIFSWWFKTVVANVNYYKTGRNVFLRSLGTPNDNFLVVLSLFFSLLMHYLNIFYVFFFGIGNKVWSGSECVYINVWAYLCVCVHVCMYLCIYDGDACGNNKGRNAFQMIMPKEMY